MHGDFHVCGMDSNYTMAYAEDEDKRIVVTYVQGVIKTDTKQLDIINASNSEDVIIESENEKMARSYNCLGELVEEKKITVGGKQDKVASRRQSGSSVSEKTKERDKASLALDKNKALLFVECKKELGLRQGRLNAASAKVVAAGYLSYFKISVQSLVTYISAIQRN